MAKHLPKHIAEIKSFNFRPDQVVARKYQIVSKLGEGWEGEVYKIRERSTGIERAAKFFFPARNINNKTSDIYARKLHALRECPIVIQYHTQEIITIRKTPVTVLISEYVEGELLSEYLNHNPGKRLTTFKAIHLLHALIVGIENIHFLGEYHGDLHLENIIIQRLGLTYEIKLLDLFHWGSATRENRKEDICDAIRVFYDVLGGQKHYHKLPKEIKDICCGLKRSLILKKFRNASALRAYLESQSWE